MPEIQVGRIVRDRIISGSELIEQGTSEVNGKPVKIDQQYVRKKVAEAPLNHHRQMKALYTKHGVNAVNSYIRSVVAFDKQRRQPQEQTAAE